MSWDDWKWKDLNSGWPQPFAPLPTREAERQQAAERTMQAAVKAPSQVGAGDVDAAGEVDPNAIRRREQDGVVLKTRGGFPHFFNTETDAQGTDTAATLRGFTISAGTAKAVVFNGVTVEKTGETLFSRTPYFVAQVTSTQPLSPPEWGAKADVWLYRSGSILVNTKGLSSVLFQPQQIEADALPFIITNSGSNPYGVNTPVSGFAVGRYSLALPNGASMNLLPVDPRSQNKAMTYGQKIKPANREAWQQQLYFTGESWDALTGGWSISQCKYALVQNSIAPPSSYATQTAYSISTTTPSCIPQLQGVTNFTGFVSLGTINIPITVAGRWGNPVGANYSFGAYHSYYIYARPSELYFGDVEYGVDRVQSTINHANSIDGSVLFMGETVNVFATVNRQVSTYADSGKTPAQHVPVPDFYNPDYITRDYYGAELYLGSSTNTALSPFGVDSSAQQATAGYPIDENSHGSTANRTESTYSGSFSIIHKGVELMAGEFSREVKTGNKINPYENPLNRPIFEATFGSAGWEDYKSSGQATWVNDSEFQAYQPGNIGSWTGKRLIYIGGFYVQRFINYGTVTATPPDVSSLTWRTTDFLLLDEENQTSIQVKGLFSGSNGNGTLAVDLVISTPLSTSTVTLFQREMYYELPLTEDDPAHVPVPRLTIFPGAMYYHQGAMCGGVYSEASEGAPKASLMSFDLRLRGFDAVGEARQHHGTIEFVPANLLEMLYAYVYSSKYGLDNDERYPVTRTALYDDMQQTLFGTTFAVNYKNGTLSAWVSDLVGLTNQHIDLGRI